TRYTRASHAAPASTAPAAPRPWARLGTSHLGVRPGGSRGDRAGRGALPLADQSLVAGPRRSAGDLRPGRVRGRVPRTAFRLPQLHGRPARGDPVAVDVRRSCGQLRWFVLESGELRSNALGAGQCG